MDITGSAILPILLFVACVLGLAALLLVLGNVFSPRRPGPVKRMPYESGMDPIHDTRRRFDVRFYLLAIAFLVFDVELLARLIRSRKAAGLDPVENIVYELPLHQWRDVAGSSVKARDFFKSLLELTRIYWIYLRPGAAAAPVVIRPARDGAPGYPNAPGRRHRAA